MIYLLVGQPGSGKTTLARQMQERGIVDFIVDGDLLRDIDNPGYHREGRVQNVDRAHAIALYLNGLGFDVAVSLVQPYREARRVIREKGAKLFYLTGHYGVRREYWVDDFETVIDPDLVGELSIDDVQEFVDGKKRRRACFIGRFQTFHDGHRWLFRQALDRGDPVLVLVRDTDEEKDAYVIAAEIEGEYAARGEDVLCRVIPDIKSVEYGRGVGYEIVEHVPPEQVGEISGTAIRAAQEEAAKRA